MSLNKVMLIGNVGRDPVVRYLDTGVCVASISLATTERGYTLPNGTAVPERTEWHNVIFWNKNAEVVEKYVRKGDKLYVEGKIQSRSYDDKMGVKRQVVEIMVSAFEMLSPRPQLEQNSTSSVPVSQSRTVNTETTSTEELPF